LQNRLGPALDRWAPFARAPILPLFHAAVLACRWTMAPDPAWARAYAEALGGTARLALVSVEATWLRFADAWPGELEEAWRRAAEESDAIHLICLRDVNRSLPQCWGRPLLDILAGYREELPPPARCTWPPNLRVLACPASDAAALPLDEEVIRHGAAIPLQPPPGDRLPNTLQPAHVAASKWREWADTPPPPTALLDHAAPLGALARAGSADLHRLQTIFMRLGDDRPKATVFASQLRIAWPRTYLPRNEDVD
jgi:hypothetical protein